MYIILWNAKSWHVRWTNLRFLSIITLEVSKTSFVDLQYDLRNNAVNYADIQSN